MVCWSLLVACCFLLVVVWCVLGATCALVFDICSQVFVARWLILCGLCCLVCVIWLVLFVGRVLFVVIC